MRFNEFYSLITSGSTSTSYPVLVSDFRLLTISFSSSGSLGPSRFTIQVSNADGLGSGAGDPSGQSILGGSTSMVGWSTLSGVNMIGVTPGMVTLDPPGYRWLRVTTEPTVTSTASGTTIILNGTSW
jgi:hypothetical protein